ncbi:MAG: dihydrodipicolinate synthase family protein [Acidobacteria bacterium]|nr:dihydrodipicolinate synthase family protein [Acidobacteriota bacterium]
MRLEGVLPPIPTPFADHRVDEAAMRANVARWMGTRVRGVVVLGSNGEAPLLDEDESDAAIAAARDAVPADRLCLAGTGRESTVAAVRAAKRAAALGADAVLVRTPACFRTLLTAPALTDHYRAVADAAPVPVILYNFTALTGVTLPVESVARLAEHPNVVGMKESGSDLRFVSALIDSTPDDFAVMAGSAPVFFASLLVGAAGGILALASAVPDLCVELYDRVRAGRLDEARALQRRLTPLAGLVTSTHGVPGLKAALSLLGYAAGDPRPPLRPVGPDAVDDIRRALAELARPDGRVGSLRGR